MIRVKITNLLNKVGRRIPKRFRWKLPFFYGLCLFFGFILFLAYLKFPSLVVCSKLFGQGFCTPTGDFLILLVSIPGYFIAGNFLPFLPQLNWVVSFVLVILITFAFYYLVGVAAEKYSKAPYSKKITMLVTLLFSVLIILAILFLLR